jgi:hypothetical protein
VLGKRAVGGNLKNGPYFLFMTKQVYMLTNSYAVMPEGFESVLISGFGYTLMKEDAKALIENGMALEMEDSKDGSKPKISDISSRRTGNGNRGKRLSKSRRKS